MRSKDNAQVNVGIPRPSPMYDFYVTEAKSRGVGLPTHIYQLLRERYEAITSGVIWSWTPIAIQPGASMHDRSPDTSGESNGTAMINAKMVLEALGGEDEE